MLERELKLLAPSGASLGGLDDAVAGAELGQPEPRAIVDTYYDTDDVRLARWGCTLRYRDGEGWTVKLPNTGSGAMLARQEIVVDGPPDAPPAEATALVRSMTRGAPLDVVARFDTARTAHTWRDGDGGLVAELVDDRVTVEAGRQRSEWRELEIELGPDTSDKVAKRLLKRLRTSMADGGEAEGNGAGTTNGSDPAGAPITLESDPRPKLVRALGAAAEAPADVAAPPVPDDPTGREVIRAAIARSVAHLIRHLPVARIGVDIEGVHQARVATRRLRSDLRTFGPLLDPAWAGALSGELKWLADELGKVRDADVLLARLQATIDADPDLAGAATNRVLTSLRGQRRRDNARLLDHLDSERADRLLDHLVDAAADPRTAPQADDPAADRLGPLVAKRWRRLDKAIAALDDPPVIDDLHQVRILAKRVRYAADAATPVFGAEAKALAKATAGLQDVLGELNDAAVAEEWLAALAERTKGSTAFSAGRLCQAIAADALPHRERWQQKAKRVRKAAAEPRWLR